MTRELVAHQQFLAHNHIENGAVIVASVKTGEILSYVGNVEREDGANESFVNLLDPKLRAASIELGYENAAKFSWDKCADETFNIYKTLMEK